MKHLGCAYYPEYWGTGRIDADARLMRGAGIDLVRIGEFAWCRMEPEDGRFDFSWLDESLRLLAKHGIQVMMCTPTAAPPAWMHAAAPDAIQHGADGRIVPHGRRHHRCLSSPAYLRYSKRLIEALAKESARHRNVVAWQIDNELGPESGNCHCPQCQAGFRGWLQARYGSLASLNRAWGTGFWSGDYSNWTQVCLAERVDMAPSRVLDSKRFWSDLYVGFAGLQAELLRKHHPGVLVTTNGMGPLHCAVDYSRLFSFLDVAADDLYFDIATQPANALAMDLYRCLKPGRSFWITETGSGALDHAMPPSPEQFRAWAWSSFARGSEAHLVFRWRTCLSGQEQELQGILEHSGKPRHRYAAVKQCFTEFQRLAPKLKNLPLPKAEIAIVHDVEVVWAYESTGIGRPINYTGTSYHEISYNDLVFRAHKELYDRSILTDVVAPGSDLSHYRLLILPSIVIERPGLAQAVRAFVRKGGTVLALGQIGMRDANNNYLAEPEQDGLQDLLGIRIEGGMYLRSHMGPDEALWMPKSRHRELPAKVEGTINGARLEGTATRWIADLTRFSGKAVLSFADGAYSGQPAAVERKLGRGNTLYCGMISPDDALFSSLMGRALSLSGVKDGPEAPEFVEVVRRGSMVFVVNHTSRSEDVHLGLRGKALVGDYSKGSARLGPYGVCVVRTGE